MADRTFWTGLEATGPNGRDKTTKEAEHFDTLFNSISVRPTAISNSGNDYTITIDPPLNAGTDVLPPMSFYIKPNTNNSGNVRIRVTSLNPYYELLKSNGEQFASDQFRSDTNYFIVYLDGKFYSLSDPNNADLSNEKFKYVLTTSGTLDISLIKSAKDPNTPVHVQAWGGGGGGGRNTTSGGGGGGGAYTEFWYTLNDLPDVISYTIGAGGAGRSGSAGNGLNGGNTIFNATLCAYGGLGGVLNTGGAGGGSLGGGVGGAVANSNATDIHGGGGGGSTASAGGAASWGGGGGGNDNSTSGNQAGGISKFGGSGGTGSFVAMNGSVPGGGGGGTNNGTGGNGARGEIWVTIF